MRSSARTLTVVTSISTRPWSMPREATAVQPWGSRASAERAAECWAMRSYVVPPAGSSASIVNPVPVGHVSTATMRRVMWQTRWTRSTHSAAIARRSALSSRETWRSSAAMASSSRASS
ncbi:hypothetical protein SMICM304S_05076 [Streptomyces microflavus]